MAYGARAVDYPDSFKAVLLSRWEPYPIVTGTAFSSHAPGSYWFHPLVLPEPLTVANVNVVKSLNAVVPGATNAASTGSEGYSYAHSMWVFQRQDYGANSTNLQYLTSASGGLTATLVYSGTGIGGASQSFGMSWVTNSTGGQGTFSTTSGAGNWSSYATGAKLLPIPFVTLLPAGEYFIAHAHSSTTATSNSNVTLLSVSNLHIAPQLVTYGVLGSTAASVAFSAQQGIGLGVASAITTNATMPGSVISAATVNQWVQNFSNA